jgi:hypothetical protein
VPSLGLKFCIIDLVGLCALAMVMCGSKGLGPLQVWISALSIAAIVVSTALGACKNWELIWACVLSDDTNSPLGGFKELLGWNASFSSLRGCSEFDVFLGAIAYSTCRLCFWA